MKNNFLNPSQKSVTPGISLFTAVKNRREFLDQTLDSWLAHDEIDEIIIVDWTSEESLIPWAKKINNKKIILVSVTDQENKWSQVPAFNLAARFTTKDKLLKMDADVMIQPGFFQKHILSPDIFFTGDWSKSRNENEKHLNGAIFVNREAFFKVNGYNEFIRSYGYDDTDLYNRLESTGMTRHCFDLDTLHHIPHQNRTQHQTMTDFVGKQGDFERSNINILMNRYICENFAKWSSKNTMLQFTVETAEPNIFLCRQSGKDLNILSEKEINDAKFFSVKDRLDQLGFSVNPNLLTYFTPEELVELYNLFHRREVSPADTQLYNLINKYNYHFTDSAAKNAEVLNRLGSESADKDYFLKENMLQIAEKEKYIEQLSKIVQEKEKFATEITDTIAGKDNYIEEISRLIEEKDNYIAQITQIVQDKDIYIANVAQVIQEKDNYISDVAQVIQQKDSYIASITQSIQEKDTAIQTVSSLFHQKEEDLQKVLADYSRSIGEIQKQNLLITELEQSVYKLKASDREKENQIQQLTLAGNTMKETIAGLNQSINEKEIERNKLENILISRDQEIERMNLKAAEQDKLIHQLNGTLDSTARELEVTQRLLASTISEKDNRISELSNSLMQSEMELDNTRQQLDSLYKSYSWRFGHTLFSFLNRLNPLRLLGKKNQP